MLSLHQVSIVSFCVALLCQSSFLAQEDQAGQLVDNEHRRILLMLKKQGEWDLREQPLADVIASFADRLKLNVYIDTPSLEDYGIGTDTPISISLKGVSNRSFLNLMLRELTLSWQLRDGQLWITTKEAIESELVARAYPVADLVRVDARGPANDEQTGFEAFGGGFGGGGPAKARQERGFDYDSLISVIVSTVEPSSWDSVGGPGSIEGLYGSLVVSQMNQVHYKIDRLLAGCRSILVQLEQNPGAVLGPVPVGSPGDAKVRAELEKPTSVDILEMPLQEVFTQISERNDIPIVVDTAALEDYGIGTDTPITIGLRGLPLRSILRTMLHELDLAFIVRDEVLMITTVEQAESELQIHLYPVGDLVAAEDNPERDCRGGRCDFDGLINTIQSTVEPDSWDTVGGPGSIAPIERPPVLPIAQTEEVHGQILDLLAELRRVKKAARMDE